MENVPSIHGLSWCIFLDPKCQKLRWMMDWVKEYNSQSDRKIILEQEGRKTAKIEQKCLIIYELYAFLLGPLQQISTCLKSVIVGPINHKQIFIFGLDIILISSLILMWSKVLYINKIGFLVKFVVYMDAKSFILVIGFF